MFTFPPTGICAIIAIFWQLSSLLFIYFCVTYESH